MIVDSQYVNLLNKVQNVENILLNCQTNIENILQVFVDSKMSKNLVLRNFN